MSSTIGVKEWRRWNELQCEVCRHLPIWFCLRWWYLCWWWWWCRMAVQPHYTSRKSSSMDLMKSREGGRKKRYRYWLIFRGGWCWREWVHQRPKKVKSHKENEAKNVFYFCLLDKMCKPLKGMKKNCWNLKHVCCLEPSRFFKSQHVELYSVPVRLFVELFVCRLLLFIKCKHLNLWGRNVSVSTLQVIHRLFFLFFLIMTWLPLKWSQNRELSFWRWDRGGRGQGG